MIALLLIEHLDVAAYQALVTDSSGAPIGEPSVHSSIEEAIKDAIVDLDGAFPFVEVHYAGMSSGTMVAQTLSLHAPQVASHLVELSAIARELQGG